MQASLEFENLQVVFAVQALAGAITKNMRAVTIKCSQDAVDVTFIVYEEDPETREEIDEFFVDFESFQITNIAISVKTVVDDRPIGERGLVLDGRVVFLRKEPI